MPGKKFLLQGLTPNTHLDAVKALLAPPDLELAVFSVAFVTKSGVDLIAKELARAGDRVDAFVGIRNDITSKEGLLALMDAGANVHYVDTGAKNLVFHPKIYVTRRDTKASAIVGSANLTVGGLHNNIESSIVLDLDLAQAEDLDFVESIVSKFKDLAVEYPQHVVRLKNAKDVERLHGEGRLVDEASSSPPQPVGSGGKDADNLPTIRLKVSRLRSPVRRGGAHGPPSPVTKPGTMPVSGPPLLEVVWRSKALTERDLGIPSGKNTHPTGSINLDKGLLEEKIDHRHYFREEVFAALDWKPGGRSTVDETHARFGLIVKGIARGEFRLRIGHTTSTTNRMYVQRNAMTRLSWGPMKGFVGQRALIGRILTLYRDKRDLTRFVVEVD